MVAMQKVFSEHVLLYRYLYMRLPYPDNPHHFQNQLYYLKVLFAKEHYWIIRKKNFRRQQAGLKASRLQQSWET